MIGVSPTGVKYDETILDVGLVALRGVSIVRPRDDCAKGGRGGTMISVSSVSSAPKWI